MNAHVKLPIVAGVEITTDAEGRFNLNALHRASGEGDHKRPSKWLATDQAQDLIAELKGQSPNSGFGDQAANLQSGDQGESSRFGVIHTVRGGNAPGTFAHELLAVSYAGWISPAFQLQVNRVFIDYRTGSLITAPGLTAEDRHAIGGIVKACTGVVVREQLANLLPSLVEPLVAARIAESTYLLRSGRTAKQIWDAAGLPPRIRGSAVWFGNRLKEGGCLLEGRADRGDRAIRLFDPDKAETLLGLGLRHRARVYIDERRGQGRMKLVPR